MDEVYSIGEGNDATVLTDWTAGDLRELAFTILALGGVSVRSLHTDDEIEETAHRLARQYGKEAALALARKILADLWVRS
jgi:hypothetical protein